MSVITIKQLSELEKSDRENIIYRKSLPVAEIIDTVIKPIAKDIIENPKKALLHYTKKFDGVIPDPLLLEADDLEKSYNRVKEQKPDVLKSFNQAKENITEFHQKQVPSDLEAQVSKNTLGLKFVPFDRAALYVPGGKALYPSTVLMGVLPAQIAGVKEITLVSPPNPVTGCVPEIVQAVAHMAGATRIVQAGGAQAVLAMAHGIAEENILPVDFIYGPGNVYVAAAKNYAFSNNLCGIDSFAGPSEVLIIADDTANPHFLAHDLLAQAEHDENAAAILLCTSESVAEKTIEQIEAALKDRKDRRAITEKSIRDNGKIFVVSSLDEAIEFSNEYAPEHLEIQTANDDYVLSKIRAAGSIFVGSYAPVAIGDYYSGTNHILPTNRGARFTSGVSVHTFYRRITYQKITKEGLELSADPIKKMSIEEGLFDAHGYSVLARFEDKQ